MAIKAVLYLIITLFFWFKTLKAPIYGLCFFAAIVFIRPETVAYRQLNFLHISFYTAIICFVGYWGNKKKLGKPVETSLLPLFAAFCIIAWISTGQSEVSTLWRWPGEYTKILIFCFLLTRIVNTTQKLDLFIIAVMLGVAFLSVWAVDQHFRGNVRLEQIGGKRFGSNEFGSILALMFPLFFFKSLGKRPLFKSSIKKRLETLFFSGTTLFLVAAIIFTGSRGAFLGFAVSIFVIVIKSKNRVKTFMLAAVFLPVLITFIPQENKERILTIFNPNISRIGNSDLIQGDDVDGSIKGRITFWKAALEMINDHPFLGVGLQNFELLTPQYTSGLYGKKDTHNTYLKVAAETGLPSFSIFVLMIFISFKNLYMARKNVAAKKDEKLFYYVYAVEAGLAGFLVSSITGSYNYNEPLYWFFFITPVLYHLSLASKPKFP